MAASWLPLPRLLAGATTLDEAPARPAPSARPSAAIRFRSGGDEAGTPLGDRKFRPDVQGLRAVAVALVVLYHAGVPGLGGGFVGVDVFFVVSGYVITGLLLRERAVERGTDLLAFYGRRCRRILPAATLVIVATVLLSYHFLGFVRGAVVAGDARAAALFSANFHFIANGTNYISSQQPPSPLQNFWSLAVEEQFYLVYPSLFVVLALIAKRVSLTKKLVGFLAVTTVLSYVWSITQTAHNATAAYFSPFTRAWELSLGALVAVGAPVLRRLPVRLAASATWLGVAGIVASAVIYGAATAYPGSAAALPVGATAMVIAGGTAAPRRGAEALLRLPPFQWLANLSYSLYLWHWPILLVATEASLTPLSLRARLGWVGVAVLASIATYYIVENRIRHARALVTRRWLSLALGGLLVGISLLVITVQLHTHP